MYLHSNRRRVAAPKPPDSRLPTAGKAQARSRLSNGRDVLPNVDGRSLVARRYRDILCAVASDQGGAERLSEARLQLIRRFSRDCCPCRADGGAPRPGRAHQYSGIFVGGLNDGTGRTAHRH
jgi:hypothetical protein